jgi:hypothetical protein
MDIFHRNQQAVGGVFTTDRAVAAIAAGGGSWVAALVQNINADYGQDYQELYELGSNAVYRVLGRPKGRMTIQRIIGKAGTSSVEEALYDACNTGGTMTVQADANLCSSQGGGVTMVFNGIFVINYGIQIAVQDQMIRENVVLAYTSFNRIIR